MNNRIVNKGKKLSHKALKSVTGGLINCVDLTTGRCYITGTICAERQCRYVPDPHLPD
ncbi:hypothetical protein H3Z85_20895 [Chryseobacterium indologenes]|uniref:hypothetical protein n=1 Tax=Chryseobacterium TaxID=59732 RepID=UPI0004B93AE0|nr:MULTISPECIES: hypothetical protein [Chryseobacterium]QIX82560.1 hypothetical protein FOB56_15500 [Chryseobacterium indologenes]QPQ51659.1 hypothetical protein H3Z85_20895 [Chryseobacterium indologenes]UDQ52209.1 hypothetical protein LJF28_12270 [Chryseobacterium indologenes]SFI78054.1 hypothetical protein SAMN05421692_0640 [Chryseobacterium indologenes]SUX50153.1 Uncharacterised protein [Chryseobacterium indologenes]